MRHMTALKLTLSRRQGPELRDTWQRQSLPRQGDEVQDHEIHDVVRAHLYRELT
jgi:hypothetical protein